MDYRLGALFGKVARKCFRERRFQKPWNGVALPKCDVLKIKNVSKRKCLEASGDEKLFSKNLDN
jgi:hypothetical protein